MFGVVSLLDPVHYRKVEELWAELESAFGLKGVYITPWPHLSYQVALGCDLDRLPAVLERFTERQGPLTVHTTGLGLFTGSRPVLFVPVVRTAELSRFHATLLDELAPYVQDRQVHYDPPHWMPHITLGFGDLTAATLGRVVSHLADRPLSWEITLDNLAIGKVTEAGEPVIHGRWALNG